MHEFVIDTLHKGLLAERKSRFRHMKTYWDKEIGETPEWHAMLLSNQQAHLREITDTSSNQAFYSMVMSTVRRMYAKLVAHEIVSVQPIDYPTAMVFYFDKEITTTGATFHDMIDSHYDNANYDVSLGTYTVVTGSPVGITTTNFTGGTSFNIPYSGGHSGLSSLEIYAYSASDMTVSGGSVIVTGVAAPYFSASRTLDGLLIAQCLVVDTGETTNLKFSFTGVPSTPVTVYAMYGLRAGAGTNIVSRNIGWKFCGSTDNTTWVQLDSRSDITILSGWNYFPTTNVSTNYQYYLFTEVVSPVNELSITEFDLLTPTAISEPMTFTISPQTWTQDLFNGNMMNITVTQTGTTFSTGRTLVSTSWRQYGDQEAVSAVQQVKLRVTGRTITAKSRKLKISWTQELEQNMQSLFMMGAEDELSELMASEIAAEIDREIVRDLIIVAPYKSYWYYDKTITAHTAHSMFNGEPLDYGVDASGRITQYEHEQTLLTKINQMSGVIRKNNVYHEANWIVCSDKVGAVIEGMIEFSAHIHVTPKDVLSRSGRLNGKYDVYVDPNLPEEVCLVGYKGDGWDAGYILAPFIPLEFSPVVSDPDDLFTLYKNAMTRYAKYVVSNKKYGLIICTFPSWYNPVNGD